jgi:hypothetical protein
MASINKIGPYISSSNELDITDCLEDGKKSATMNNAATSTPFMRFGFSVTCCSVCINKLERMCLQRCKANLT